MRKTVCMLCPSYCYGEPPPCESIGDGEGALARRALSPILKNVFLRNGFRIFE
jgi:hypothetical protein